MRVLSLSVGKPVYALNVLYFVGRGREATSAAPMGSPYLQKRLASLGGGLVIFSSSIDRSNA